MVVLAVAVVAAVVDFLVLVVVFAVDVTLSKAVASKSFIIILHVS